MTDAGEVDAVEQAAGCKTAPLLVREPLEAALDAEGLGDGPLEAWPIGDGHSNLTFLIRRGSRELVLRRPPRPPFPPSAHDVLREARLLQALESTGARVPRVLLVCADEAVIGAPFYVMERIAGDVVGETLPERFAHHQGRRGIALELVRALVGIHAVDTTDPRLSGFGRPSGYLGRQLRRFTSLWEASKTRELPALDATTRGLSAQIPTSRESTLVHGDFRLGNLMFGPGSEPRVAAVLDWEMATLGDPLADVGYLAATWAQEGESEDPMTRLSRVTREPGFPSRDELVESYEKASGRCVSHLNWYMALAVWKSAIFLEGSYRRYRQGMTDDPFFASLGEGVPRLAQRAEGLVAAMQRDRD